MLSVVAVVLASCENAAPTAPARVPKANLSAVTDNEQLPFSFNVRGCTERVHVTGTFHVVTIFNLSPSGSETDHFHINASGMGTGLTSGTEYRFNDAINLMQQWRDNTRTLESDVETLKLNGVGSAQNMILRGRFHITVNANGETTAEFDQTETVCQ